MLGLIKTTDFIAELEKALGVSKIKAGDIAYEIDQKLFKSIRDALKQNLQEKPVVVAPNPVAAAPVTPTTKPAEEGFIIQQHPASRPYYGSAPQVGSTKPAPAPAPSLAVTTSSKITDQKLTTVVVAPKQETVVKPAIDPYREPIN